MFQVPTVLFVGTTNLHHSRLAEAVFNHLSQARGIGWCACSRGLALPGLPSRSPETPPPDPPGLSPQARDALNARGIELHHTASSPNALRTQDLEMAYLIIGLGQKELEPLITRDFSEWCDQFNFWDIAGDSPAKAFAALEKEVEELLGAIESSGTDA